jgi:hypothetical protein
MEDKTMSLDKALYNFARRGVMPAYQGGMGSGPLSMGFDGKMIRTGVGREFFVSNNFGSDSCDGSSWDKAFKTLAAAISANNTDISADKYGWDSRNRIYLTSGPTTENLVAFPNKCDVIGVGSYDANDKPGITGNHAPVNAGNYGTRWINVWFKGVAAATPVVDLASSSSGTQFIGSTLDGALGTMTHAIRATASPFLKVYDCDIFGLFATAYIGFGTGDSAGTVIEGNKMHGSNCIGIVNVTGTTSSYQTIVASNFISVTGTGITIDDEANGSTGILYCYDNVLMNGATLTNAAGVTGIVDCNAARCARNICRGADITLNYPIVTLT